MKRRDTNQRLKDYISTFLCTVGVVSFVWAIILVQGCSLKRSGKADVTYFSIEASEGLVGLPKSEIVDLLGLPEGTATDEKGSEYWLYKNERHYHFIILGRSKQKDLILQFEDSAVSSVELKDRGSSWHLSLPPLVGM